MGQHQQTVRQRGQFLSIKTEVKEIILHEPYRLKLLISYASAFPNGYEGLKLWDSNIVLARYVIINCNKFTNMSVLQLSSGTGICGIAVEKWTSAKKIVMTDTSEQVIGNIKANCTRNKIDISKKDVDKDTSKNTSKDKDKQKQKCKQTILKMHWNQFSSFQAKYDVILANDPFTHHCSPDGLIKLVDHFLSDNGIIIISASNSEQLQVFIKLAQQLKLQVRREKINNEQYMKSPILNQVQGQKEFPQVCKGQILIYQISRKSTNPTNNTLMQKHQQLLEKVRQIESAQINSKESNLSNQEKSQKHNPPKQKVQPIVDNSVQKNQTKVQQSTKKVQIQQPKQKKLQNTQQKQQIKSKQIEPQQKKLETEPSNPQSANTNSQEKTEQKQ